MSFELSTLLLVTLGYLACLFLAAWVTERGLIPSRLVRHPLTYVLSLGVYASAWAIYGSVGFAHHYGMVFLAYYLGICGAFFLAPVLLAPILKITRTYQLGSLADLFAFRFRSSWAGTLSTALMVIAILPLLALQIQAVADAVQLLTHHRSPEALALGFCLLMILFSILFGARHTSSRERHEGLVFAIAFESVVKLVAMVALSLLAVYQFFDGPEGLERWLESNQSLMPALEYSLEGGPWRTLLLVFFASAVTMPHMFHMIFTENLNRRALLSASWGMPLFLLVLSLCVIPILASGLFLNAPTNPEYFTLGIGIGAESPLMSLLAYIAGLSASSGLIIVTTLALSAMVLNHLVLPFYQPSAKGNIYSWLGWTRRILISTIILASYGFYHLLQSNQDLSNLAVVAFVGTLQFLPGILATLYWPTANRQGFIAGLLAGGLVWTLAMLIPLITGWQQITLPLFDYPLAIDGDTWNTAAILSLSLNSLVFIVISMLTRSSAEEISAASACAVDAMNRPQRRELSIQTPQEFQQQLGKPLGARIAQREVNQALRDLGLGYNEKRPYALRRLRDRIQANLSGLMGPSVAQEIVDNFLPYKEGVAGYITEDIHFMESRLEDYHHQLSGMAAELDGLRRYHRETLKSLPMAVCSLGEDQEILMWNRVMEQITGIESSEIIGSRLGDIPPPWRELLQGFVEDSAPHLYKQQVDILGEQRWISLHKAAISATQTLRSGTIVLLEDLTDTKLLEEKLVHSERLASIGRLAAGVAHEIGNPITGIACLAQEMREEADNEEFRDMAQQVLGQTQRVTRIVQSLVNFSHSGTNHQQNAPADPVNMRVTVNEAIDLLSLSRKEQGIRYNNQIEAQLTASGDSQRLLQVFVNLLSNARDASPPNSEITISCGASEHTLTLSVSDQGSGIPEGIRDTLFEPFVTTKDPGKGTGLGLALVYSIIEEHFGKIEVVSPTESGRGTCIQVTLPRYQQTIVSPESH
ncbi:sensor histidine kinase [Aestuariirhabdus litorea]|uniref:histidine kinase n=1 Tax=Aestuariirhabdus litorea TaxID=2528527 RepID=A0A3P3VK34_9GAMM|nr:sensor histidine kinase [Aestuariirhabdus litorea]RRJ82248.1 PAS domain S-box protein [Aestuariirhabdus litorea]RWW92416.1 PAS domain S-box protein [Endozoicomonadaceae bacterium GTF-13]